MKLQGTDLTNALGTITERNACQDYNTGYSPAAAAVTAPAQKPKPGFDLN